MNKIVLEKIIRVNKPSKLRLSATLSALSAKMDLIPTKLISALKDTLKNTDERTYVRLISYENKDFKTEICKNTNTQDLKKIYLENKNNEELLEKEIKKYAKDTLGDTYAQTYESRLKEIEGSLKSIIKGLEKKQPVVTGKEKGKKK